MRSKIFVPGSRPELFSKAMNCAADGISFDLEDAVVLPRKAEARLAVRDFLNALDAGHGKTIVVRVNAMDTPYFEADITAMALPRVDVINVPKVETTAQVQAAAQWLALAETRNGVLQPIGLLLNIETPKALRLAAELAAADSRVVGLQLGLGDLFEPAGIDRGAVEAVQQALFTLRMAAAEAGVPVYDGAFANIADVEGYRQEALLSRRMGFAGKSCIHPSQIAIANEVFSPTQQEVEQAHRVVLAADKADVEGTGAYVVDGKMIDAPFAARARAVLSSAKRMGLISIVVAGLCLGLSAVGSWQDALAQPATPYAASFPSKPITIVVPYPAGGSNDVFARQMARELSETLQQPVVVDNRPGSSGTTGAAHVAKAAPDGYTLVAVSSSFTTNAATQSKLPFDPIKGFAPVAMFAKGPLIVAVNNDFAAKTPKELIAAIKAKPGVYNYASSGTGSVNQFATEWLKVKAGNLFITHIPYRGMGPAVSDVIGNQTQVLIASGPSLLPMIRAGRLRAIGITSLQPSAIAPELTPMATAVPSYEFELWWGLLAPAGTPSDVVSKLNAAVNQALAKPLVATHFLREGAVATPLSPVQFASVIAGDVTRWKNLVKQQNMTVD